MRCSEMKAEQERLFRPRLAFDGLDRPVAEQVGHITVGLVRYFLLMELLRLRPAAGCIGTVIAVIGRGAAHPTEAVVAALERAVAWPKADAPSADEATAVA